MFRGQRTEDQNKDKDQDKEAAEKKRKSWAEGETVRAPVKQRNSKRERRESGERKQSRDTVTVCELCARKLERLVSATND